MHIMMFMHKEHFIFLQLHSQSFLQVILTNDYHKNGHLERGLLLLEGQITFILKALLTRGSKKNGLQGKELL